MPESINLSRKTKKPESLPLLPHFKTDVLSTNYRAFDGAGDQITRGAPDST